MSEFEESIRRSMASEYRACRCDFCTGKKSWDDNWCPHCGNVKMEPPKWWENLDVCDACEVILLAASDDDGSMERA